MKKYEKEILQDRLDSEEQLIKELDKLYEKVSKDCSKKIAALSARSDLENLQSIIYQEQYQQALKDEIDGLLNVLHSDEFKTISDYTTACYQDGFLGVMYSLHKQGIPLIIPINQEAVIKAVQLDSKISEGLYNHLGESISEMKENIRAEVSRGVTAGLTYNQISVNIAKGMNTPFTKAKFYATRIARTEGGRIANSSAMDASYKAKERGCDIVKQWDSTLDGDTRKSHQQCDGEIRELDEKFSNGLMFPGDPSGGAAEVINCRCVVLQRARIALDEEDLEELKERAAYFGLDKTENFNEFKQKYLQATELENIGKNDIIKTESKFILPDVKLTGYALDPNKRPNKAEAFKKALGYTKENYSELKQKVLEQIDEAKFVEKGNEGYGMRYEYIMRITGANGKEANVLTAWIDDGKGKRLTSIYVTKKGETK